MIPPMLKLKDNMIPYNVYTRLKVLLGYNRR